MNDRQEFIVEAVSAWNPAIGEALKKEIKAIARGGEATFREELITMLTVAYHSLDRNPAATRANLENALTLLKRGA